MADNFGTEVSRVLNNQNTKFTHLIWQSGKPPLDSELNFVGQLANDSLIDAIKQTTPSGFLADPISAIDFECNPLDSNQFRLNAIDAIVNGMPIRIRGCNTNSETTNIIKLSAPPATGNRVDLVFLEVWRSLVSPNPSTDYKPSAVTFYKYGNTQFGGTNITDDLIDNDIGFETTKRVQIQYRLRVETNIDIDTYPQGLGDPSVFGQGNSINPVTSAVYTNMASEGDPSCWKATSVDFESVDNYSYAIPICAVFRRNTSSYVAVLNGASPTHNGASLRSSSTPKTLTQAVLSANLTSSATTLNLGSSIVGSGLDEGTSVGDYLVLNTGVNKEIVLISNVNVGTGAVVIVRGQLGTEAKSHLSTTQVSLYNPRPDGLYADQIHEEDILDLMNSISLTGFDYSQLLQNAVNDLITNNLRTAWKSSATGSDSKGITLAQVDVIGDPNTSRPYTEILDAPNGIRTVWSDSAVVEKNVNIIIDPTTALNTDGTTVGYFDSGLTDNWTISADLKPTGFMPNVTVSGSPQQAWCSGAVIFLNLGGLDGVSGARKGFKNDQKAVRFLSPWETDDVDCLKLYFINDLGYTTPVKLLKDQEIGATGIFYPMNVFGGLIHPNLKFTGITPNSILLGKIEMSDTRLPIDILKNHYNVNLGYDLSSFISGSTKVLQTETIENLITANGKDATGYSSELYAIIYGNPNRLGNNAVFQIVGFGNSSLTKNPATNNNSIRIRPLESATSGGDFFLNDPNGNTLTLEIRTKRTLAFDGTTSTDPSLCIVLNSLSSDSTYTFEDLDDNGFPYSTSKLLINATLQYAPGHSGLARTPDQIFNVSLRNKNTAYLRNAISDLDPAQTIFETDLVKYDANTHIQLWNALRSKNADPSPTGNLNDFGGKIIGGADIDRNNEIFTDPNSKTLVLRPFKQHNLLLQSFRANANTDLLLSQFYQDGITAKDGAGIFTGTGLPQDYFEFPPMHLPKFGRQDIPFHSNTGLGDPFLNGLHHLFIDTNTNTDDVYNIIGGDSNEGSAGVEPMLFYTAINYGTSDDITTGHPSLGARKVSLEVPSTDFGNILNGIELPPYHGFARVYGVYEKTDYLAKVGSSVAGGHESDRVTPIANPPINLLRTDATKYTMFIRQDGARDVADTTGSHTYILTEHSIDIRKIPTYVAGDEFADFDYVVECCVFGFANGFINKNGFILIRKYDGAGVENVNLTTLPTELQNVDVVIPSPFGSADELFVEYSRTAYQGDVYHTRGGSVANYNDEVIRHGQLNPNDHYYGGLTRKQFNTDGSSAITITNPRAFAVLASMDFYLTLGTGNIGGTLYENTVTDVGYESTHTPPTALNQELIHVKAKAFNESEIGLTNANGYLVFSKNKIVNSGILNVNLCTISIYDPILDDTVSSTITITNVTTDDGLKVSIIGAIGSLTNYHVSSVDESNDNFNILQIIYTEKGTIGNRCSVSITFNYVTGATTDNFFYYTLLDIKYSEIYFSQWGQANTKIFLKGGTGIQNNAGNGSLDPSLIGLTSRLPLGLLVNDYDFLGEDILNDGSSYLQASLSSLKTANISLPISSNGLVYSKVNGVAGDALIMSEAVNDTYIAFTDLSPSGTKTYRTHRGAVLFGASGKVKGGAVSYVVNSFPTSVQPVLKGGVLACKAMLVQNFDENAFTTDDEVSYGSELQLVIITQAIYRSDVNQPITLQGSISPSGYGEGYASADRFNIKGRPVIKNKIQKPNLTISPAPYTKTTDNNII